MTLLACAWLSLAYAIPLPARLAARGSQVITYRDGSPAHVFVSPDDKWRIPVTAAEVDPTYLDALIRFEDKRFRHHPGVDPVALLRAAWLDIASGHTVSGGSTLTMQLVRVLEPRPRTLRSKLVEAFRALQLETRLSKQTILEAYLRYIPFGRNVEGVEAASLAYFGHGAGSLSAVEIATLLAVPQKPGARFPSLANTRRLKDARARVAARLFALTADSGSRIAIKFNAATVREIEDTPVPEKLIPFPRTAAHAAYYLSRKNPSAARIHTTLDRNAQQFLERRMLLARADLSRRGIWNGAAVIVDHEASVAVALAGSFDWEDTRHGGQIEGFAVRRSPGSALKPFIYALVIDGGIALPEFLIADIPKNYGGYTPRNYDGHHSGLVRMDEALSRSLNSPFVDLLGRLGVERFLGAVAAMGVRDVTADPGTHGLSAAVGGVEITPLELASAYATLAMGGRYRPLSLVDEEGAASPAISVFSPGAAALTRKALSIKDRPDFADRRRFTGHESGIAWKTGTSYGHHDAWAAGSTARLTAVVWLGNFDQSPSAALVGGETAGPILFDLLEGLTPRASRLPPGDPATDLAPISVCAYSGRLPGPACPQRKTVLGIKDHIPTETCAFHVTLDVEIETGLALNPGCRTGRSTRPEHFLLIPDELRAWLKESEWSAPEAPRYAEGCAPLAPRRAPHIVLPEADKTVFLIPGLSTAKQEIPFSALAAGGGRDAVLHWFVDGTFLGTVAANERAWWRPREGQHEIVVTDDAGLTSKRRLRVQSRQ